MNIHQKIIAETAAHFNKGNRAVKNTSQGLQCTYRNEKGGRCAVGRYIKDEFIGNVTAWEDSRLEVGHDTTADSLFHSYPFDILKEEYQVEDVCFWLKLQSVHDRAQNWDAFGPTEEGRQRLEQLKLEYQ